MSDGIRWYPSKVDAWLAAVLLIAPALMLVAAVAGALSGELEAAAVGAAGLAFLAALYGGLVWPMRYGIAGDVLLVRHGLVRQRIPLRDIREVTPTENPLSSPALSLDRLNIAFGEGFFKNVMISPADKDAFLDELAARAGLRRERDRLVRDA